MAQYIDKSALVAEIERRRDFIYKRNPLLINSEYCIKEDNAILDFIDTLEVKEVGSTDAFIEKAEKFIYSALNDGIMGTANIEDFMRLFKKYMKGG